LPSPLKTLERSENIFEQLKILADQQGASVIVAGLPRSLEGNETAQTAAARAFVKELKAHIVLPVYFQDEAVTSKKAEQELRDRGVTYNKGEVDALAATYILSDFLQDHPEV
jgi:putative Holliday junction resolvase